MKSYKLEIPFVVIMIIVVAVTLTLVIMESKILVGNAIKVDKNTNLGVGEAGITTRLTIENASDEQVNRLIKNDLIERELLIFGGIFIIFMMVWVGYSRLKRKQK